MVVSQRKPKKVRKSEPNKTVHRDGFAPRDNSFGVYETPQETSAPNEQEPVRKDSVAPSIYDDDLPVEMVS